MSQAPNPTKNVGWQVWNMSKRISSAMFMAKVSRRHLENCRDTDYWKSEDIDELERLTVALEDCAERAKETWTNLKAVPRSRRDDTDLDEVLEQASEVYRSGNVAEYWELVEEFKRLMVRVEWEGNRIRWNAICKIKQERNHLKSIASSQRAKNHKQPLGLVQLYALSSHEISELHQLSARLATIARQIRSDFNAVGDFTTEIDPDFLGSSLWSVPGHLEERMIAIRSTESLVEDSRQIELQIDALLSAASRRN